MFQDLRFALRRACHTPTFSISVIVILAIGVGAATTMGSVFYALALRPVGLAKPDTLVAVSTVDDTLRPRNTPLAAIDHLRSASLAATGWCAYNSTIDAVEFGGRVVQSYGELLSGDCLSVVGIAPAMGRWFSSEEGPLAGSGAPVIVITDRYWKRMFDSAPDVLGRTVRLQNVTATVIGVMPERYRGLSQDLATDFIIPFNAHRVSSGGFTFIGRLKAGAAVEQLKTQVRALWPSVLEAVVPAGPARAQSLADWSGNAESLSGGFSTLRRLYAEPVRRLAVLAFTLLLLVCINVGGLMVSRITGRSEDIASMRALGANSIRIVRPLILEGAIFAIAGAALGVPLAFGASAWFPRLLPTGNMPWAMITTPETGVLAWVVLGTVVMTLTITALPAWLAVRRAPRLRTDRTVSRAASVWARALLVGQVAVTVVLVFTCGLVVRSFNGLRSVNRGYDHERMLSLRLAANPAGYKDLNAAAYYPDLLQRVAALPGVRSVGTARYFGTINAQLTEQPVGFADSADNIAGGVSEFVSPGFFSTIGAPLLRGRDVAWTDLASSPKVAVVSDSLARSLAPDGDVVGRVIRYGTAEAYSRLQIVGVVGNLTLGNLRETAVRTVYVPSVQFGETAFATVHIRTEGPPMQLARIASDVVAGFGREHVMGAFTDVLVGNSIVAERMGAVISGTAAVLALVISGIGLFALLSHSVATRTKEIGIRIAVGATPATVSRAVVGDAMLLVLAGLALGFPASAATISLVRSLLYGITATDSLTIAMSAGLLIVTGFVACALPALRATRVDPATALRSE